MSLPFFYGGLFAITFVAFGFIYNFLLIILAIFADDIRIPKYSLLIAGTFIVSALTLLMLRQGEILALLFYLSAFISPVYFMLKTRKDKNKYMDVLTLGAYMINIMFLVAWVFIPLI